MCCDQGFRAAVLLEIPSLTPSTPRNVKLEFPHSVIHSADCWCAECKEVWTDIVPYRFDRKLEAEADAENDP